MNEKKGFSEFYPDSQPRMVQQKPKYVIMVALMIISALIGGLVGGYAGPALAKDEGVQTANIAPVINGASYIDPSPVVNIAEAVGPAVVGITTKAQVADFFSGSRTVEKSGSGFIISPDGYIVTNNHVVDGASELMVSLSDDKMVPAKLIGRDEQTDLAVLKIATKPLTVARLGDSEQLKVGELAVAIGNPLGNQFARTVTAGVVSAINRTMEVQNREFTLIQTDAAISPGNSGGPLVNARGEVIGINTVKVAQQGVEGLGFAIPITDAKPIIDQIIKQGFISRPMIGIGGLDVTKGLAEQYGIPEGFYVQQVFPGGPAFLVGMKPGDVITDIDNQRVKSIKDLTSVLGKHKVGDKVNVKIDRDGKILNFNIKLMEKKQ